MKISKSNLFIFVSALLVGCQANSPEQLANDSCDCYKQAKAINNTTKKLEKIDECYSQMQSNLSELQQLGVDNDWTPEQVDEANKKFQNQINKCNGADDAE